MVITNATGGHSYSSRLPEFLQRLSLPLIAVFGRLRGFKASYD